MFRASLSRADVADFAFETLRLPDGMEVNYKVRGDRSHRTILLIHGGGDSLSVWESWVDHFGGQFCFISVDLPGHGLTAPFPDGIYSTKRFARFVSAFVAAMELKDFVIVGHSFGGETVLRYVLANPEAPAAMILTSPGGYTDEDSLEMPRAVATAAQSAVGRSLLRDFGSYALFSSFQYAKFFHDRSAVSQAAIDRQFRLFRYEQNRGVLLSLVSYEALHHEDVTGLSRITCPTFFLLGRDDNIVSLGAGLRLSGDTPHAEHVIYDHMGHMSHIEMPEQNASDARAFLAKHGID
ncbi:alpha/beta fold hydrolase [Mycobacterium spongiae]|uniref:Alpha/beta fold hydrolase n=1 Tax=Mycobacterium spongiae TaxID=886343 RepID=A0A975K077_9MYCO|nr:alpha/beta hydrolase [Mycobacterium spongiae]QUR68932.1 alpha/beta fold hydrolase [Mycobacterium spongiae]